MQSACDLCWYFTFYIMLMSVWLHFCFIGIIVYNYEMVLFDVATGAKC